MNLTGIPKERRTQLFIRDDGTFIFRKLDVENTFLVSKDASNQVVESAWLMPYKLLKRFDGYKNIGADMVTLSYGRDIVLDLFNQLGDREKPNKGADIRKEFVRKIAQATFYKHVRKAKGSLFMEKVTMYLGVILILLALAIGLKVGVG